MTDSFRGVWLWILFQIGEESPKVYGSLVYLTKNDDIENDIVIPRASIDDLSTETINGVTIQDIDGNICEPYLMAEDINEIEIQGNFLGFLCLFL